MSEAYLEEANRFVHGYFTKSANQLHLTIEVEDSASHKMLFTEELQGPVLAAVNTLAKELEPKAESFSTNNEAAVEAWGRGDLEKAVLLDPNFGTAWLSLMEAKARTGDSAAAIEVSGRALAHPLKSQVDGLRIALARASLQKDATAEHDALVKLTALIADPQLLLNLGAVETRNREFALAEGDYKKILAVDPENLEAMNLLGYAYGFQGKLSDAESTFARYAKEPGQAPNAFDSMGEVYFMNGKFPDAEKSFLKAHELNAAFLAGGDLRKGAYAHWLAGDLPGADAMFSKYLEFRAKMHDPTVEWQHAGWEFTTGRKDQALARLVKSPSPQSILQARVWRGEIAVPLRTWTQLKKAYDNTTPTADGLFRTLYAEALISQGKNDEAKKLAARWPLPDSAGDAVLHPLVFPKYIAVRRILGL